MEARGEHECVLCLNCCMWVLYAQSEMSIKWTVVGEKGVLVLLVHARLHLRAETAEHSIKLDLRGPLHSSTQQITETEAPKHAQAKRRTGERR